LRAFQDNAAKNSQPDIVSAGRGIERGQPRRNCHTGLHPNWSCHRRV